MILALALAACHPHRLSDEELQDPKSCQECHPDHYEQWSGSMHAYASVDPVFRAMEAQGQRETNGELGDFCVKCHAPAGVALGAVETGDDIDGADPGMTGVTCYFCHQVADVKGDHNNPLVLAEDRVMRGPLKDPVDNPAHDSAYSGLHDRYDLRSADLCGSCHDIVTPLDGHIEATFSEWQSSLFASAGFGLTCAGCHMVGSDGVAADFDGVKLRRVHDHGFPGVDRPLVDFPDADRQAALVQSFLDDSVNAFLCVKPGAGDAAAVGILENVAAGHLFPSGATADRRAWVEIVGYLDGQEVYHSGAPDPRIGESDDPDLWRMWSTLVDEVGAPTHKFWEAASIVSEGLLPVATTLDTSDPDYVQTHVQQPYTLPPVDKVELTVHLQPIGAEVLDELDLDPGLVDQLQPLQVGPTVTWTADRPAGADGFACAPEAPPVPIVTTR
jgi:hypothetical protein